MPVIRRLYVIRRSRLVQAGLQTPLKYLECSQVGCQSKINQHFFKIAENLGYQAFKALLVADTFHDRGSYRFRADLIDLKYMTLRIIWSQITLN